MNEIAYLGDVISKNSFAIEIINAGGNSIYDTTRNQTIEQLLAKAPVTLKQERLKEMVAFLVTNETIVVANEKPFNNAGHDISQVLTEKYLD